MAAYTQQLTFQMRADTTQAKKDIQALLSSLKNVGKINLDGLGIHQEIYEAAQAAQQLSMHLRNATNANTGQLNLIEFNNSIKASGQSMAQLMATLADGGNVGQQAFQKMATAIANTQVPIKQTNTLLSGMMTTLKNAAKWQMSSSVIHGLQSAFSGAVSYVKDLNTSLTNIRVVTGQSTDDMARFAQQANKMAKELSTTTKAYADASLIYYQQGDSPDEVAKKAAITIKAANASFGSTAAEMSEYLTAVWNSYQVGADELERYVDIMAALGAKTATSLEEIATSMQKVAATANTVGVSMEQVSSIIATVSSVTRESAESIGTSFKTIFARIGDLKLGKTLEDGVNLGQVSSQLQKIGVSVLDATGNLRDMGTVIEELMAKWGTMTKAEQTATAQVVAGKRQYTQWMALMENSSMYQENMDIASSSKGSLEQMSSTYEEGVKAAQNRAKASTEALYSSLLDDKMLIQFSETVSGITDNITNLVDALGGLGGVATTVGGLLLKAFSTKIGTSIKAIGQGIASLVTGGSLKNQYTKILSDTSAELANSRSVQDSATLAQTQKLIQLKTQLLSIEDSLTAKQAGYAQSALSGLSEQISELNQLEQEYNQIERSLTSLTGRMQMFASMKTGTQRSLEDIFSKSYIGSQQHRFIPTMYSPEKRGPSLLAQTTFNEGSTITTGLQTLQKLNNMRGAGQNALEALKDPVISQNVGNLAAQLATIQQIVKGTPFESMFANITEGTLQSKQGLANFQKSIETLVTTSEQDFGLLRNAILRAISEVPDSGLQTQLRTMFNDFLATSDGSTESLQRFLLKLREVEINATKVKSALDKINTTFSKVATGISSVLGVMTSLISGFKMFSSSIKNISADSSNFSDNLLPLIMGLSMMTSVLPKVANGIKTILTVVGVGSKAAGPWGWIISIVTSLLGLGIGAYNSIKSGQQEADRTTKQKNAETASKVVSNDKEEISKNQELIVNYNNLYETYQKTGQGQEELKESAYALAEAYGIIGANVLIAEGNFEQFNNQLKESLNFNKEIDNAKKARGEQQAYLQTLSLTGTPTFNQDYQAGAIIRDSTLFSNMTDNAFSTAFNGRTRSDKAQDKSLFIYDGWKFGHSEKEYSINQARLDQLSTELNVSEQAVLDFVKKIKDWLKLEQSQSITSIPESTLNTVPIQSFFDQTIGREVFTKKLKDDYQFDLTSYENIYGLSDINFTQLFEGPKDKSTLKWNELDYTEQLKQFKKIEAAKTTVNAKLSDLYALKNTTSDESLMKDIDATIASYENLIKIFDLIVGENSEIGKTIREIGNLDDAIASYNLYETQLQNFIGRNESDKNTTLIQFNGLMKSMSDAIDHSVNLGEDKYPELEKIAQSFGSNSTQYQTTKNKLMSQFIKDYTAFDQFILIWEDVVAKFTNQKEQDTVFDMIQQLGIKDSSQITSGLLNAFKLVLPREGADTTDIQSLISDPLIQAIMAQITHEQQISDYAKYQQDFSDFANLDFNTASLDSLSKLYTTYEQLKNSENNFVESMLSWDEFVKLNLEQRATYLSYISEQARKKEIGVQDQRITDAQKVIDQDKLKLQTLFPDIVPETAVQIYEAYQQELLRYTKTENGKYILTGSEDKTEKSLQNIWDEIVTRISPDGGLDVYSQSDVEQVQKIQEDINNQQETITSANAMIEAMKAIGGESATEKITRMKEALKELSTAAAEFAKNGQLSAKAMVALQKNGIDPKSIKTTKDYINAMIQLEKAQKSTYGDAVREYEKLSLGKNFDINESWTDQEIKDNKSLYDAWETARKAWLDLQESEGSAINAAVAIGQVKVAEIEARVKQIKEEAEEVKNAANTMAGAIETGELSEVNKLLLQNTEYLDAWEGASSAAERGAIAAKAWSDYAAKMASSGDELTQSYTDTANKIIEIKKTLATTWNKFDPYSEAYGGYLDLQNRDDFLSYLQMQGIDETMLANVRTAWDNLVADGIFSSTALANMSNADVFDALNQELTDMGAQVVDIYQQAGAEAKDGMAQIGKSMAQEHIQAAETAANAWITAFNNIAAARKKLIKGESLLQEIAQDPKKLLEYANAANMSVQEFTRQLLTGELTFDKFKFQSSENYITSQREQYNLDKYDPRGQQKFGSGGVEADIRALGYTQYIEKDKEGKDVIKYYRNDDQETELSQETVQAQLLAEYKNILADSQMMTEQEAAILAEEIVHGTAAAGAYSKIGQALQILASQIPNSAAIIQASNEQQDILAQIQAIDLNTVEQKAQEAGLIDTLSTVNGVHGTNSEYLQLQQALENAKAVKDKGGQWEEIGTKDLEILDKFKIKGFDQIDGAAIQCASALQTCAAAAAVLAESFLTSKGYKKNAAGEYELYMTEDAFKAQYGEDAWETLKDSRTEGEEIEGEQYYWTGIKAENPLTDALDKYKESEQTAGYNLADTEYKSLTELAGSVGMTRSEFQEYADSLNDALETQDKFDTSTEEGKEQLYEYAKAVANTAQGFEELQKMTEDTWKSFKGSKKGTTEWIQNMESMRKIMSKIFNTDLRNISQQFVEDHLDEMEKMATGTAEEARAAQDAIEDDLVAAVMEANGTANIEFQTNTEEVTTALDYLQTALDQWDDKEVGFTIDADTAGAEADVIASLNSILATGQMTAEQITAALNSIGWEPKIEWKTVEIADITRGESMATITDKNGNTYQVRSEDVLEGQKEISIPVIGSASRISSPGGGGGSHSSKSDKGGGGGGGDNKPKSLDLKKPDDEIERYHVIKQKLDRLADALDTVNKMKERTFGKNHLKNLESEITLLGNEIELQQRYIKEAKDWLAYDAEHVRSLGAIFDEQGNISNYDAIMKSLIDEYNAFISRYNASDADAQKEMSEQKEKMDKWYKERVDWIKKYEETLALLYDKQNEILELQNQISQNTLEKIQYKVEYKVEINEAELDYLEYLKDKYEEVIQKQGLIMDNYIREGELAEENLNYLGTAGEELEAAYTAGTLKQADYVEGLQELQEQIIDNLSSIQETKKSIEELYGDTLESADEELNKHIEKIDSASEAMESYMSILGLMGKGSNFDELNFFFENQYKYNTQSLKSQMDYLKILKEEEQYYLTRLESAEGLTETERAQYESLQEVISETQDEILSKTEDTLSSLQEMYNNTIESIMKNLTETIAGQGNDFNWLSEEYSYYLEEFERYVSSQKELYEISKLNRNIQNSIDNTTSSVHKQQLKELQDEINKQSELKELSEYEINMMNLKYELLLKQIALEEAQNAKNTVRLTRDSEGNMIYQYTADQEKITKAQQEYEDVLQEMVDANYEQIHDVEQQTVEAYQNMVDQIKEIATDETLTQEQKMARISEIVAQTKDYLAYLVEQYNVTSENIMFTNDLVSEHYNAQLVEHSKNAQDNLNNIIADMIANTDEYVAAMEAACGPEGSIQTALNDYMTKINEVAELTKLNYDEIVKSTETYDKVIKDVVEQNSALAQVLEDEVLPQIHNATDAWDEYYNKLSQVISQYEEMYNAIQQTIKAQSELVDATEPEPIEVPTGGTGIPTDTSPTHNNSGLTGFNKGGKGGSGSGSDSDKKYKPSEPTLISTSDWKDDTKGNHYKEQKYSDNSIHWIQLGRHNENKKETVGNVIKYYCSVCGKFIRRELKPSPGGCFVPGTKIIMSDNSIKNIEDVLDNEFVMAYNTDTKEFESHRIVKAYPFINTPRVINITLSDGTILGITPGHPILTTTGWKSRDQKMSWQEHEVITEWLNVGDEVIQYNKKATVIKVEECEIPEHYTTYNLWIDECHTFIADGVVVHNAPPAGHLSKVGPITQIAFATGGVADFTGPAWLDGTKQKPELILNSDDTQNMFKTVDAVRQLDKSTLSMMDDFINLATSSMMSNLFNIHAGSAIGNNISDIEQNVHITAEFPNVQDSNEIQDAFDNLINRAAQYIGSKKQ